MTSPHFDYLKEAHVTASGKFYTNLVPLDHFKNVVNDAINALEQLDAIKKALFYGKPLHERISEAFEGEETLKNYSLTPLMAKPDIIHAIIGIATESGELLEALYSSMIDGNVFDDVNFAEELGDVFWYQALGIRHSDETFDSIQKRNIAKLRARFPNAFNEHDANNRNLLEERSILEKKKVEMSSLGCDVSLTIEVSGPQGSGKNFAAELISKLMPNAKVIDKTA